MKTKITSLLAVLFVTAISCTAQRRITVEAANDDISNYLDLKAVATVFGESNNLEDFEKRLNDYDNPISNLDLNDDGDVDYIRVIETYENDTHVIVLQAILQRDVYQDVATIVVDRDEYNQPNVRVIGDPYIYGNNYIFEPVYYHNPFLFSWFWTPRYHCWVSPYYWGNYPGHYRNYHRVGLDLYLANVRIHIDRHNYYRYNDSYRNDHYNRMYNSIHRNDFGDRHPEGRFDKRNENMRNKHDFRTSPQGGWDNNQNNTRADRSDNNRSNEKNRTQGIFRYSRPDNDNGNRNSQNREWNSRNNQNSGNREADRRSETVTRQNDNNRPIIHRESNQPAQPRVVTPQPTQQPKVIERKPAVIKREEVKTDNSRNENHNSRR